MTSKPVLALALATALGSIVGGCDDTTEPPAPPLVSSMSPSSGPYGTEVTIEGEHFGDPSSGRSLDFDGVRSLTFVEWSDTRIRFRVPFPGAGTVSVNAPGGRVDAGEFVPDAIPWSVSRNLGSIPVAAVLLTNGNVGAAMLTGANDADASVVSVVPSGTVTSHDLGRTIGDLALVDAFETEGGRFEAFFGAAPRIVERLAWSAGGAPTIERVITNVQSVLTGGHDASGTFLWTISSTSGGDDGPIVRLRPPASSTDPWAGDLAFALPHVVQNATMSIRGAVDDDGRLFVTWGKFVGGAFDQVARPIFSTLDPATTTWTHTTLGDDVDDYILATGTRISRDGSRALVDYCWSDRDFDPWNPTDPEIAADCVRDVYESSLPLARSPNANPHLDVLDASGLVSVTGDETSGYVIRTATEDLPVSLWPARPVWLLYDATNGPVLLVESSGTYVIRPSP